MKSWRALLAALVTAGFVAAVPTVTAHATPSGGSPGQGGTHLGKHDRELLATAVADKKKTVSLLVGSVSGNNAKVTSELQQLGGVIRSRNDSVDYLRAIVPVAKAEQAAELAGVQTANLDESIALENPAPPKAATQDVAPPNSSTPPQNPYLPTQDIGAPQFVAAHPTYDGRGVVMGILDTGVDLQTPALQTAMTASGTPTRKIVDWVTETDPLTDNDPTWVNMAAQVTAQGGSFTYQGVTYTAPADGAYRIGIFNERDPALGGELANDVNRDGNPPGSSGLFAVLWNTSSNTVWVDTNQNHSFADQAGMTDYKVHDDIGTFGTDNPATPERETVPFVVQTDAADKYVNIGIVSGLHGTHVAGVAAGNGLLGGAVNGAAPEAQIVSVRVCTFIEPGCTEHGQIEGAIYAEKTDNVDVINESVGGVIPLNDGNDTVSLIYNRLIEQSKAEMVIAAGNNGPGLNTVAAPGVASDALEVGAYLSKQTFLDDFGSVMDKTEQLWSFSSRGPREDGGFKPDIVAPGTAFSTVPAWEPPDFTFCPAYECPTGYTVESGTSMAAPEAAGGAALLISAAKQAGAQWKPDQLKDAIDSSARFIPGYQAHEQGNGLMQVGAAWNLLKQNIKTVNISSSAPVNTVLSGYLATPNRGPGIYQREGWVAGDDRTLNVTLTRNSGGTKAVTYSLSWIGNDGTFSAPTSVALGKTPMTVPVRVHPQTSGAHSAILVVDDPTTPGRDYEMLNSVIAALPLNAADGYNADATGTIDRADGAETFFTVPAGVSALVSTLHLSSGEAHIYQLDPTGSPYPSVGQDESFYCDGPCDVSFSAQNPPPGVWDISVESAPSAPGSEIGFDVNVSAVTLSIAPPNWTVDPASLGTTYHQTFTIDNEMGPFVGGASGTSLGDAYATRPTITTAGGQQVYFVDVPPGSTRIAASIGNTSDPNADLDLYLFDCSSGSCQLADVSGTPTSNESVQFFGPDPGTWAVLVDPFSIPSGSTAYDYEQSVFNPANGVVSVSDPTVLHASGSSWTVSASVTPNIAPPPGHFLQGFVRVLSPAAGQLAIAEVDLRNVQ